MFDHIVPTTITIDDPNETTRRVFSTPIHSDMYVSDSPMDTYARAFGYTKTDIVYTFGKGRIPTYTAVATSAGNTNVYGTSVSKDGKIWSNIANTTSANPMTNITWDGLKWIAVANTGLLYSYSDQSFSTIDVSNTRLTAIETNGRIYVGIGPDGILYSYDGLKWKNSASGTALIHNTNAYQTSRVLWNGSIWVICGDGAAYTIIYSSDGITWSGAAGTKTIFDASGGAMDVAWNGQVFVATGIRSNGYATATSTDGITWSGASI